MPFCRLLPKHYCHCEMVKPLWTPCLYMCTVCKYGGLHCLEGTSLDSKRSRKILSFYQLGNVEESVAMDGVSTSYHMAVVRYTCTYMCLTSGGSCIQWYAVNSEDIICSQ